MLPRFVILLGLAAVAYAGLPPGRPLPDVPILQAGGKKLDLKQYRGKALVLMLIATTCAHCTEVVDLLKQIQIEQGPHGLQVVVAAGDDNAAEVIGSYATEHKTNFPLGFVDRAGLRKLANLAPKDRPFVPIILFVDPKGIVRVQFFGDDPLMRSPEVIIRGTVRELLKEPGITPAKK
jgi:hypothetical protein